MSKHVERKYLVEGKIFDRLADARSEAESIMVNRHRDDYVMIKALEEGDDFFEPYARIVKKGSRLVMER